MLTSTTERARCTSSAAHSARFSSRISSTDLGLTGPTGSWLDSYMPAAKNIASLRWIVGGRIASFQSSRCFGVVDESGRLLSIDGQNPATWGSLRVAKVIAEFVPPTAVWLEQA